MLVQSFGATAAYAAQLHPTPPHENAAAAGGEHAGHVHSEGDTCPACKSEPDARQLSDEDTRAVQELKARDAEVRAHEQAHLAAAGGLAQGGAHYTYTTGPDGRQYATGGEVKVDTSPVRGDPQKTIEKAGRLRRAALAPADPSGADRAVAAKAAQMEAKARIELARSRSGDEDHLGVAGTSSEVPGLPTDPLSPDGATPNGEPLTVGSRETGSRATESPFATFVSAEDARPGNRLELHA